MLRVKSVVGLLVLLVGLSLLNLRAARATTLVGPDLIIESMTFTPENPDVGDEVTIRVTVRNVGDASSGGVRVHLYVDPAEQPPTTETQYTSTTFFGLGLAAGGSFNYTRTGVTFGEAGRYPIYVWVDRDDSVSEGDESNNLSGPHMLEVGEVVSEDAFEPDNTCAEATELVMNGVAQTHNLHPVGDVDWVQFTVQSGVRYKLDVAGVDISADIHPTCTANASFSGSVPQEFTAITNGTYFARIYRNADSDGADSTYTVRVSAATNCNARYEPNNSCNLANLVHANGEPQVHDFCETADVDWFALHITSGYSYTVVAENAAGSATEVQLELYGECNDPPPLGSAEVIEFSAPYTGYVYFRTFNNDPDLHGPTINYEFKVSEAVGCSADIHEPNDSAASAALIEVDAPAQTHNICPANDPDWVEFIAAANKLYTLETLGLAETADTVLCLYDNAENEIACDDDSGEGLASRLEFIPTTSGIYKVRVKDRDDEIAGEGSRYELQINSSRCTLDAFESDNDQTSARPITVNGAAATHNACAVQADHDWHSFVAGSGQHVIETFDLGAESDTVLRLYQADGSFLMQSNDVHGTVASQIEVSLTEGETYYVEIFQHDPSKYGTGTAYSVQVRTGQATPPPPTPTPLPPTPTPPPPPQSEIKTLIVVNETRMRERFGSAEIDPMMTQLNALAAHENVKGEIVNIDDNTTIAAAYTDWDAATGAANVEKANQTATALRNMIQQYGAEHLNLRYLVLVGDDRMLPFYRVVDEEITSYPESTYSTQAGGDHPTAIALAHNYYLTDDFYGDSDPVSINRSELFVPELATGRLVETASEITAFVSNYLITPATAVDSVLVTGYDFIQDSAQENCTNWQAGSAAMVNCTLIGGDWSLSQYRNLQLLTDPAYQVRSISGHATHYAEGSADSNAMSAAELLASYSTDGGIVYTPGCHAGLNVPPTNQSTNSEDNYATDLPQSYLSLGYNYIGNTGYGWGTRFGIGLSESLTNLYTEQLLDPTVLDVGTAFVQTKQAYYRQQTSFTSLDKKVLQQWMLYGLPMFQLTTSGQRAPTEEAFPSANFDGLLAFPRVTTFVATLDLIDAPAQNNETAGTYFALDGHTQTVVGEPVQPLFFADVTLSNTGRAATETLRGVALLSGNFSTQDNFDPLVAIATNEFFTDTTEPTLTENGWQPALPVSIARQGGRDEFQAVLGQYAAETQQQRVYENVGIELYYSSDDDVTPPTIHSISGLYDATTGEIEIKVGSADASGIYTVIIAYIEGESWQSKQLVFNETEQNWTGVFTGTAKTRYIVQVVDEAGNVTVEVNKGQYLAVTDLCSADPTRCGIPLAITLQAGTVESSHPAIMLMLPIMMATAMFVAKKFLSSHRRNDIDVGKSIL